MRTARIATLVALLLAALPTPWTPLVAVAQAAGVEEEARRQLDFARKELDGGDLERAARSAESALRLNPVLYEALVVKALAYHGLGRSELALTLLAAYEELDPTGSVIEEARAARARIQAELDARPGEGHRVQQRPLGLAPGTIDPAPYKKRVDSALADGHCSAAEAAATELCEAAPRELLGWRLLGDALRCDGRNRDAVSAYQRFQELGGDDPSVTAVLEGLKKGLGGLTVRVDSPEPDLPQKLRVLFGDEELKPRGREEGSWRFDNLPVGESLTLQVAGRGLRTVAAPVEGLKAGEVRELELTPEWIGVGQLSVPPKDCGCEVFALSDAEAIPIPRGRTGQITAGDLIVEVRNDHGAVQIPMSLAAGQQTEFDPFPWLPTALTVVGVPAGSRVLLNLQAPDGGSVEPEIVLDPSVGKLDPVEGVRIAPPVRMDSLLGGDAAVAVVHPVLGDGAFDVLLAPGAVNASSFEWKALPGVAAQRAAFAAWSDRVTRSKRAAVVAPIPPAAVAVAGLVTSMIFVGLSVQGAADADALEADYKAMLGSAAPGDIQTAFSAWRAKSDEVEQNRVVAAAAGGGAGLFGGITLAVALGTRNKLELEDFQPEAEAE